MQIETLPETDRAVLDVLDGWNVKQYFNKKAGRWYATISQNSLLARHLKRHRLLRSHYVYMRGTNIWHIEDGYVVHHVNFDSRADQFSNLEKMTAAAHDALHREYAARYGFPSTFKGRKHRPETIEKMRAIAQERGNNDVWDCPKTHHDRATKALMSLKAKASNNAMFRDDLDPQEITQFYDKCRSLKETAIHFGCSASAIRYRLDPKIYIKKLNPLSGRERRYRFDNAEMVAHYNAHGAKAAATRFGCTEATIYYRVRAFTAQQENIK